MSYKAPGSRGVVQEKATHVYPMEKMLSYRDTWRQPLNNFDFDAVLRAKFQPTTNDNNNKENSESEIDLTPLQTSEDGFRVIDKSRLSEQEVLVRDAQRALNQLAEENFDVVVPPLLQPALFTPKVANQVVERIFEKCIDESKFAPLYARMCLKFCTFEHEYLDKGTTFRRCLVEKVQALFEEEPVRLEKKVVEEEMSAARKRKMGNIMLIAQLLLCGVLSRKVCSSILDTIFLQQQYAAEIDVEIAAELIDIVCGATPAEIALANQKTEEQPNLFVRDKQLPVVMKRVESLMNDSRFCKRVQFKLMEIVDMGKRGWQHRPGTQAKAKLEKQQLAQQQLAMQILNQPSSPSSIAGDGSTIIAGATTSTTSTSTPPTATSSSTGGQTPASGTTGTPLFPKEPAMPSSSSSSSLTTSSSSQRKVVASSKIPARCPKMDGAARKKFVTNLKQSSPTSDSQGFAQTVTSLSVVLQSHTVPVNRMACLSAFTEAVGKSSEQEFHQDAIAVVSSSIFSDVEVLTGFRWTVIEGVRDSIREDCPKFFDRLAILFAHGVLLQRKQPLVTLIRELFAPATEKIAEALEKEKEELDEEICAEELVHAWESFVAKCVSIWKEASLPMPPCAECMDAWSKAPFKGPLEEIALPDIMGACISSGFTDEAVMQEWVDTIGKKDQKFAPFVAVIGMLI